MSEAARRKTSSTPIVVVGLIVIVSLAYWLSQSGKDRAQGSQSPAITPTIAQSSKEISLDESVDFSRSIGVNRADELNSATQGQFLVEPELGTAEFLAAKDAADSILAVHNSVERSRIVEVDQAAIMRFVREAKSAPSNIQFDVQFFDDVVCTIDEVRQFIESESYSSKIITSGCETYRDIRVVFNPDDGHFTATLEFGIQRYTAETIGNGYALVYQTEVEPFTEE